MANVTSIDPQNIGWDHPNVKWAIIVSLGAGLSTAIGGSLVFFPALLRAVPQSTILGVSLALSAGVMIYVSFIEIFAKSYAEIESHEGMTEGKASAITTICFFGGMMICVGLELLVHWMLKKGGAKHEDICAAHMHVESSTTQPDTSKDPPAGVSVESEAEVAIEIVKQTGTEPKSTTGSCSTGDLIGDPAHASTLQRMGLMTAVAIAIHNFPEGLATFLATVEDTSLGASLGVAIAVHNIPEGLCVAMPIYYASGSKAKALFWCFLSGITEPIGGILGFAALQPVMTPMVFGVIFGMVGGMMVFIVCHELLPAAHRYMGSESGAATTAWFVLGMVIMATSLVLFVL
jgi:ZIP family zinc transporter